MREGNQEECPFLRHCKSNKVMLLRLSVDKKAVQKQDFSLSTPLASTDSYTLENTSWLWGERRKPPIWIKNQHITTHHLSSRLGLRGEKRARKKLCLKKVEKCGTFLPSSKKLNFLKIFFFPLSGYIIVCWRCISIFAGIRVQRIWQTRQKFNFVFFAKKTKR